MTTARINLLPRAVVAQRAERRWRGRWACAVGVAAAMVGLGTAALRMNSDSGIRAMRAEVARLESQRAEVAASLARMQGEIGAARTAAGAATVLAERPDWGSLLAALDNARDGRSALTSVSLELLDADARPAAPGEGVVVRVSVGGVGTNLADVQAYALRLEQSGVFDAVSPMRTSPVRIGDGAYVAFELDAVLAGEGRVAGVTP